MWNETIEKQGILSTGEDYKIVRASNGEKAFLKGSVGKRRMGTSKAGRQYDFLDSTVSPNNVDKRIASLTELKGLMEKPQPQYPHPQPQYQQRQYPQPQPQYQQQQYPQPQPQPQYQQQQYPQQESFENSMPALPAMGSSDDYDEGF